jgi:hypothetical protein
MKSTLTFDLSKPEEKSALRRALNADNAYIVFHELTYKTFRNLLKYESESLSPETIQVVERLRDELFNLMSENKIDLDDLE